MCSAVNDNRCRSLNRIPTDLDNLEAKILQYLSKLNLGSSVMPKHLTKSFISVVLLLKVTTIFGIGLEMFGGIININDF